MCGEFFRAAYVDKEYETKTTQPMAVGHRFEYLVTGALLRNGEIPPDVRTKSGKTAAMKYAERYIDLAKEQLHPAGEPSVLREVMIDGINYKGIFDWYAKGEIIQDIKTAGSMHENYGYTWKDIAENRPSALGQPKMYTWLEWRTFGDVLPFEFHVYSTAKRSGAKIIPVDISKGFLQRYDDSIRAIGEEIMEQSEIGFAPTPCFSMCSECPLREVCDFASNDIDRDEAIKL